MHRYIYFKQQSTDHKTSRLLALLTLCSFISLFAKSVESGASSNPKNLVSLGTPNDGGNSGTNLTTTISNQFQNEYQFNRQGSTKPSTNERHKASTSTFNNVVPTLPTAFDHPLSDSNGSGGTDYPYVDSRIMTNVPDCKGRLKLNGVRGLITDGSGYYQINLQCIWLIDSGLNNATIRIQIHQFNTECNYDFLYVFDGDSVYSPLVAALSGDMKDFSNALQETRVADLISLPVGNNNGNPSIPRTSRISTQSLIEHSASISDNATSSTSVDKNDPINTHAQESFHPIELKTHSGKAFIYFHSDTAQSMPGFYMTYSIDSCPLDCSNRGECDLKTLTCKCNKGYFGDGCQHIMCPNNCNSPINGYCDKDRSCICYHDFSGADCSKRADQQHWTTVLDVNMTIPSRAFHHSAIIDQTMWVFGGKSQALSNTNMGIFKHRPTPMILSYDLSQRKWNNHDSETDNFTGWTGIDHLAELSGHSVAVSGTKAFIYGGMAMNNTILTTLTVFDTKTKTLNVINSEIYTRDPDGAFNAPLSCVGHSANIIDGYMYVFLGYNPIYGYLNFAQKFNIASNRWSIVGRRGSSVNGVIGHTSTFDHVTRLVYIYGGHNVQRSRSLYSFNPQTEVWTFLHSGPSPRYYHSALIMNGLLTILGGNSYNTSHQSDQCYQPTHLVYDLSCANQTIRTGCARKCWSLMNDDGLGTLKRHGHSTVVTDDQQLILYGGFNGILLNDLYSLTIQSCSNFTSELDCKKPKLGLSCSWNAINSACEIQDKSSFGQAGSISSQDQYDCSKTEVKKLQVICESKDNCNDCLNTNIDCVWCGLISQCNFNKCKSPSGRALYRPELCYREDVFQDPLSNLPRMSTNKSHVNPAKVDSLIGGEQDHEADCKVENCYSCQSKAHCSWQNDACVFSPSNINDDSAQHSLQSIVETDALGPILIPKTATMITQSPQSKEVPTLSNSTHSTQTVYSSPIPFDPLNRTSMVALISSPPYYSCDVPCFMRHTCDECSRTKCIWCSTTEQCIDSAAYFAYHAMGQCMHYIAHSSKCSVASCSDINTCDKCLTNPKCGWLNDISNTGKGRCIEGPSDLTSSRLYMDSNNSLMMNNTLTSIINQVQQTNWFYTSCPNCQCNGHSYCKQNSSTCVQPCADFTEGPNCDRCISGYYGDPVNGGSCRPCKCNGHAQTCNRETGKCYCSTKGIIGHNCNRCDDKNHYVGDPTSGSNGTCYYNLTTDYQYIFNMSKPEDHFYSDINFINVPIRKDSDADFSITCSRLALVNITSGSSYKDRRMIQTGLECGSFRLRFPHDRHPFNEANYSFFIHVYKFQTPFILHISFSQHRSLYLPQFFFTFSR